MIDTRMNLRHRLMAIRFAIWDLHLYLDTHCGDRQAAELISKYKEKYKEVLREYQCKYGPLTATGDYGELWLKTPFPWVNEAGDC